MSADFTSIANLINQHADGTPLARPQLVAMLEEAGRCDSEVTANAAHAVTYHQADRDAFLRAAAERASDHILERLQFRGPAEPYNFYMVSVALRSAAGAEVDALSSSTTR